MHSHLLLAFLLTVDFTNDLVAPTLPIGEEITSFINRADMLIVPESIRILEHSQSPAYSDSDISRISKMAKQSENKINGLLASSVRHTLTIEVIPKYHHPGAGFDHFKLTYSQIEGNEYRGREIVRGADLSLERIINASLISMDQGYGVNHPYWSYLWSSNPKCSESIRALALKCAEKRNCKPSGKTKKNCQTIHIGGNV